MTLQLRIELRTDAAPGTGAGGPDVDRDVPCDDFGVPYLPGRRLKGLLREACQEVIDALALAGLGAWSEGHTCGVEELFGTPEQEGRVTVGDARLAGEAGDEGYDILARWLAWDASQEQRAITPETILRHLTTVRTQTAIDARTGAALHGALRSTRLVRRGLRFASPLALRGLRPDSEESTRRMLALAAGALRHLGASRNRGAGVVRCQLWDDADLTAGAVAELDAYVAGLPGGRDRR